MTKNPPAHAGDMGSIPELKRYPGEGNDNLFLPIFSRKSMRFSCLGNLMDRGGCQATVHGIAKELDTT